MMRWILDLLPCWGEGPFIFKHGPLRSLQEFGRARKLRCDKCGKCFAMNDEFEGAVLPWNDDLEELYAVKLGYGRTIK